MIFFLSYHTLKQNKKNSNSIDNLWLISLKCKIFNYHTHFAYNWTKRTHGPMNPLFTSCIYPPLDAKHSRAHKSPNYHTYFPHNWTKHTHGPTNPLFTSHFYPPLDTRHSWAHKSPNYHLHFPYNCTKHTHEPVSPLITTHIFFIARHNTFVSLQIPYLPHTFPHQRYKIQCTHKPSFSFRFGWFDQY
jgi:hypothetical protein